MFARLLFFSLTVTTLLLAGGTTSTAKPPDLPDDPNIQCTPLGVDTPECFDPTAQDWADDVCVQEETEDEPPMIEVIGVMPREAEILNVMPHESEKSEVVPGTSTPATPSPSGCVCPYLKQQAAQKKTVCPPPVDLQNSVLDELKKLQQAARLYHKAEHLQKTGRTDQARECYKQVQDLCPGSRFDAMSATKLQEIAAKGKPRPEVVSSEEQEAVPAPAEKSKKRKSEPDAEIKERVEKLLKKCQHAFQEGDYAAAEQFALRATLRMHQLRTQSMTIVVPPCVDEGDQTPAVAPEPPTEDECSEPTPGVQEEVEQLLEACHQAIKAGCLDEAMELAHRAQALDPTSVAADALVYKTHMLVQLKEEKEAEEEKANEEPDTENQCEPQQESVPDPDVSLRPELPAVDPKIVDALERILAESGEPALSKLIIIVAEEPVQEEEQIEEPISQWPYLSTDLQMPSLLMPMLDPLSLQEEEDDEEAEEEAPMEDDLLPFGSLNELLRDAVEVLQQGGSIDVDDSKHGCLRFRCQTQAGSLECQLFQDNTGHGYMTLKVRGVAGDLRAAQIEHNQRVIDWIDEVGGVEPPAVPEETVPDEQLPEEEEDEVPTNL